MIVALRAQREAEETHEALRRSEDHFKLLYQQAPLGYQSLDAEGLLLEVNQAWLDLLGYSREEVLGKSFAEFLTLAGRTRFEQRFASFKEAGVIHDSEFEVLRSDGESIVVSIDGRIARDEHGGFVQTHCILHDITAQKHIEWLLAIERDLAIALTAARQFAAGAPFVCSMQQLEQQGSNAAASICSTRTRMRFACVPTQVLVRAFANPRHPMPTTRSRAG